MKRIFIPFSLLFFLLVIGTVQGKLLNLTGQTPKVIDTTTWTSNGWVNEIGAYYDTTYKRWFLSLGKNSQSQIDIQRWDLNLTDLDFGHIENLGYNPQSDGKMVNYNDTHLAFILVNTSSILSRYLISKNTLTFSKMQGTCQDSGQAIYSSASWVASMGISEDLMVAFMNNTKYPQNLTFIDVNNNMYSADCPRCYASNLTDLDLFHISEYNEYWLFYRAGAYGGINKTSSKIYVTRYKLNPEGNHFVAQGSYGYTQISTGWVLDRASEQVGGNIIYSPRPGSMKAVRQGDFIYVLSREARLGQNNHTIFLRAISIASFVETGQTSQSEETWDLSDYDSTLNDKIHASGFGLGYDPVNEQWVIFYDYINATVEPTGTDADGWYIVSLGSSAYCACSEWNDAGECGEYLTGYQKEWRTCNPPNCDIVENFTECEEGAPITYNRTQWGSKVGCTDWYDLDEQSSAEIDYAKEISELEQSDRISVVNATAKAYPDIHIFGYLWDYVWFIDPLIDLGSYKLLVCNPSYSCSNNIFDCQHQIDYGNGSFSVNYEYNRSQNTMTSHYAISDVQNCRQGNDFIGYGWSAFRLCYEFSYWYYVYCGGRNVCVGEGEYEYSVPELEDCTLNMTCVNDDSCVCPYGCNQETGLCYASEAETIGGGIGEGAGDIFSWIKGEAESTFSRFVLIGLAIGIVSASMIIGYVQTNSSQVSLAIGSIVALLFFYIGWLDAWMVILWVLTIVLIYSKTFIGFFKGST